MASPSSAATAGDRDHVDVMVTRYLRSAMSESDQQAAEVEARLGAALLTLARLDALDTAQAERVAASFDRLTSQLHRVIPTPRDAGRRSS
jgi:phosphoserine phosphatase